MPGCCGYRVCLLRSMRKMLAAVSRVLAGAAQKPVRLHEYCEARIGLELA